MKYCILLLLLSSCSHKTLSVHSDYFDKKKLASAHLDTPDPRKDSNEFGQRLLIDWNIKEDVFVPKETTLSITCFLVNGEKLQEKKELSTSKGSYIFTVYGDNFYKKRGIQTYQVKLCVGEKEVARSKHKLWVDKVQIETGK